MVLWQSVMFAKASVTVLFAGEQGCLQSILIHHLPMFEPRATESRNAMPATAQENAVSATELGESSVHSRNQSEKIS